MLREITLREAVERIEKEETVWAVNLENKEKQLVDLRNLFSGVRILADLPDAPQEKKFAAPVALRKSHRRKRLQ